MLVWNETGHAYMNTSEQLSDAWIHPGDGGVAVFRVASGVASASSTPSPARPATNEDRMSIIPLSEDSVLIAVADGCGGMPGGEKAATAAVEALGRAMLHVDTSELVSGVLSGFDQANQAVTDLRMGAGSTLSAVLVTGMTARAFYAGDSPAAVIGQRGTIRFATLPHSLTGYGVEAGFLSETEAAQHEDSGVVLNVLGFPEMFVHVGQPVSLRPMDTILVASDGLSDNIPLSVISSLCRLGGAASAVKALMHKTTELMTGSPTGHPDDLSIVLYRPTPRKGD